MKSLFNIAGIPAKRDRISSRLTGIMLSPPYKSLFCIFFFFNQSIIYQNLSLSINTVSIEIYPIFYSLEKCAMQPVKALHMGNFLTTFQFLYVYVPQQLLSKFLITLRSVFQVFHMEISIMQWRILVGVYIYCKAPILRTLFVFTNSCFYHIFLFVLYYVFQMFLSSGFTILYIYKKS